MDVKGLVKIFFTDEQIRKNRQFHFHIKDFSIDFPKKVAINYTNIKLCLYREPICQINLR